MTTTATNTGAEIRPVTRSSRVRPWIALAAAAIVLAVGLFGVLPFIVALPVIGVVLALGSPPDYVGAARPVAYGPRTDLRLTRSPSAPRWLGNGGSDTPGTPNWSTTTTPRQRNATPWTSCRLLTGASTDPTALS
jgi:hypothetical protein